MKQIQGIVLKWSLGVALMLPLSCAAEKFVEINAELEINDWDYRFWVDGNHIAAPPEDKSRSIFTKPGTVHCIVGTNSWMVESGQSNAAHNYTITYWFTGTNIVNHTIERPDGVQTTRITSSTDGNPGRPVRVLDVMFGPWGKASWLAFCSGPFLKNPGRQIPLPSDLWKETQKNTTFPDNTIVFPDDLGLPQTINEYGATNQLILQYQVRRSTNVLGWNFPLEFYLVQYSSSSSNGWHVHLTAKGRVTDIHPTEKLEIPADVFKHVQKH